MTPADFLNDNSRTTFLSRIAAFLNIPTDRIKIVGIRAPPSTTRRNLDTTAPAQDVDVIFVVEAETIGIPKEKGGNYDPAQ